jgi:phosphoglycerate dehydrogenase-like enzyme
LSNARRVVFNMRDERPSAAPPEWVPARLREVLPAGFELVDVASPVSGRGDGGGVSDEALAAVRGAEVYLGLGLPRPLLQAALEPPARLRWVHTGAAGVASALHPELVGSDVVLTNSAGIHAEPMAETVLGMILHFARGLDLAVAAARRREWGAAAFEDPACGVREVAGATLGIIGFGGIGRAVARRARALGMEVLALRRRAPADGGDAAHGVRLLTGADALRELLEASDVVVLTLPSTPETRGLLGSRELGWMRPGAVLVNVARGDVVDEAALADVLRGGGLRGAGLDVFATEPLPRESPLWELPNVLITPHVSATSSRYWERQAALIADNLERYGAGRSLRNVVDTGAGY